MVLLERSKEDSAEIVVVGGVVEVLVTENMNISVIL